MKKFFFFACIVMIVTVRAQLPDTWTQKADFGGTLRYGAISFSIGGKGYIGTGYDNTARRNDFWEYDPSSNTWTQKADVPGGGREQATGFSIGSRGYIGTGLGSDSNLKNDFWEYDPSSNTWTQKANFGGEVRYNATGFSIGGKGYIGTGRTELNPSEPEFNDFWEYDPSSNTWTQKANFGGDAREGAAGFSIGGKGYIGTGRSELNINEHEKNDFWEYDPSADEWTRKTDFGGDARWYATGFSVGSKGYIGTGINHGGDLRYDFWEYDPSVNTWTQKVDFVGTGRREATGFSVGSKGYIGTGEDNEKSNKDFWEYTPQLIMTGALSSTTFCPGPSVAVPFSTPGIYNVGNIFTAQLSDASGAFAGAVDIGSLSSVTSGIINAIIPSNTPTGAGYRIRVVSSDPVVTGMDNGTDITIHAIQTFYRDADGDGYGNPAISIEACSQPVGYVTDNTDCDDTKASVHPGALEICDGIDNNCNGQTDETTLTAWENHTPILCSGGTSTVIITATGGVAPYTYTSSCGVKPVGNVFSGLKAGSYSFTVTDHNGCKATITGVTISQPAQLKVTLVAKTSPTCGMNNGSITLSGGGGTPSYKYSLSSAANSYQSSNIFTGLAAGNYRAYLKDVNGCIATLGNITIKAATKVSLSVASQSNVTCKGSSNGSVKLKVSGGVSPYSYTSSPSHTPSGSTFSNLPAGTYNFTVTDGGGCSAVVTGVKITEPATALTVVVTAKSNTTACNKNNGSVTVKGSGGAGFYKYCINGISGNYKSSVTFTGLAAGNYTVYVKDRNGCIASVSFTIGGPAGCTGSFAETSAFGGSDGRVTAPKHFIDAKVLPNPSESEFTLILKGNSSETVEIRVLDMYGKTVHRARGSVKDSYRFGSRLAVGIYVVQVLQGNEVKTIKVVKGK